MNILIVSYEAWRDTNNGGNVLSNIFSAFPDANIAQIYCSGEEPENSICRRYFQISDSMLLKREKGRVLEEKDYSVDKDCKDEAVENRIKNNIPKFLKEASLLARELLWVIFKWKTENLKQFVIDFKPDIIFAPCYSYFHVSKLALFVKSIVKCPMLSYISDDNYSLKQLNFYPSFWINRLITRKWIRKLFKESSLVYTMTEMQKSEYEKLLHRPMKVLCKSALFEENSKKINKPIRFIYAGGLYLNRWKVLGELSKVLNNINKNDVKAQLHVYTSSKLSGRKEKLLNDDRTTFLHTAISYDELLEQYKNSDVAIHVESFDLKNRLITRLSFSTKIIDCMSSGCAILAIGPDSQAGIAYLKDNDAAICVTSIKDLSLSVEKLINKNVLIEEYAQKAAKLGKKNHIKSENDIIIRKDFYNIAEVF